MSPRYDTFFNNKILLDVVVKFGDQRIFAHKLGLVQNSVWFEKALLGDFKEANETVVDLGSEDDSVVVIAMLRYFYEGATQTFRNLDRFIQDLRALLEAKKGVDKLQLAISLIQTVLGPNADSFADKGLQEHVLRLVVERKTTLFRNALFQRLLVKGEMFDEFHGQQFASETGESLAAADEAASKTVQPTLTRRPDLS